MALGRASRAPRACPSAFRGHDGMPPLSDVLDPIMSYRFGLTWEYRCPFARIVADHVITGLEGGADWEVEWIPFSLTQAHVEEGEVEIFRIDAQPPFRQQEIAEHDTRALIAVRKIENLGNDLEAVSNVERSRDGPRIVSKACAQHLPQVALFGFCRYPRGRSSALAVDHHYGSFHHGR